MHEPLETASNIHRPTVAVPAASGRSSVGELDSLNVTYRLAGGGHKHALKNVSIVIQEGEFVALVGRSGCGKTTILNALAGLVEPASGSVTVLGAGPREARSKLGYMLARDALLPWRTALGNAELGLELHGAGKAERRKIAAGMLEGVGLGKVQDHYPWQLSHGMRQRVALARTWATNPRLLLMDEPFAALDAQTRDSVRTLFLEVWESDRKSVVFVTHDITEALLLADRVLVIEDGAVKWEGAVPFERPRKPHALRLDSDFLQLESKIWDLLN